MSTYKYQAGKYQTDFQNFVFSSQLLKDIGEKGSTANRELQISEFKLGN